MLALLGNHLDALYVSVYAKFPEPLQRLFYALKEEARNSGDDMYEFMPILGVPGGTFYVRPFGRGRHQFVIENASIYMAWSTWENLPMIDFQFKASALYEYELAGLEEILHRVCGYFLGDSEYRVQVSRVDVACDFQQDGYTLPSIKDCIKRARHWSFDGHGDSVTAVTFGERTGALQAQIYCKSLELEQSEKAWMLDVWEASGNYDAALPVWRAEVRFYREGLRGFDVSSFEDLREQMGDLVAYSVSAERGSWLRVNDRADRHLKDRSARRPARWWTEVSGSLMREFPGRGRKRKGYDCRPSFYRAVQLAGAHMARAASIARLARSGKGMGSDLYYASLDPAEFGREIGQLYAQRLREHRKGATWAEKVNERTAELRAVAW